MAISGFTGDDRNALWRDQCRSIGASLLNPYLRVLFAFLTIGSGEPYEAVLVSYVLKCSLVPYDIDTTAKEVAMVWACAAKRRHWVKKCMEYEVEGSRPRGRPRRTWKEVV